MMQELHLGDIYLKETKSQIQKDNTHPYVHVSFIDNSQDMEAIKVSIDTPMDKEDFIYTHTHTHKEEYVTAI